MYKTGYTHLRKSSIKLNLACLKLSQLFLYTSFINLNLRIFMLGQQIST